MPASAQVLVRAHADVMPHLTNPHLLTDFLTHALDAGGLSGMLALHGIFTLVTRHGLEYPHFYRRLYSLLTLAAMQACCSAQQGAPVVSLLLHCSGQRRNARPRAPGFCAIRPYQCQDCPFIKRHNVKSQGW